MIVPCLSLALAVRFTPARAEQDLAFRVVVDPENPATELTREVVAEVFLKASTRWPDGATIKPVDQKPEAAVRKAFSERILKRTIPAVRSYWQQRIFSGRDVPPPELESDEAVIRYVRENRGAVGYVSGATSPGGTKVVSVK
jgi:ABC-type phosphate transport system substrate-binding protein